MLGEVEGYVYLHVESPPLSRKAMMGLRGSQHLLLLHPMGFQAKRRTDLEEQNVPYGINILNKRVFVLLMSFYLSV